MNNIIALAASLYIYTALIVNILENGLWNKMDLNHHSYTSSVMFSYRVFYWYLLYTLPDLKLLFQKNKPFQPYCKLGISLLWFRRTQTSDLCWYIYFAVPAPSINWIINHLTHLKHFNTCATKYPICQIRRPALMGTNNRECPWKWFLIKYTI